MASLSGWGITLIIIGIGSWILPLFNLQFRIILLPSTLLGIPDYFSGIIFIVLGALLYFKGREQKQTPHKA